jgi:predicted transcriptional regulator
VQTVDYQAITVRIPMDLYERLRREAFETRTSQAAIITAELAERYDREEAAS